jgi:hypothetical protein
MELHEYHFDLFYDVTQMKVKREISFANFYELSKFQLIQHEELSDRICFKCNSSLEKLFNERRVFIENQKDLYQQIGIDSEMYQTEPQEEEPIDIKQETQESEIFVEIKQEVKYEMESDPVVVVKQEQETIENIVNFVYDTSGEEETYGEPSKPTNSSAKRKNLQPKEKLPLKIQKIESIQNNKIVRLPPSGIKHVFTSLYCPNCEKLFTDKRDLKKHVESVHYKIKRFKCVFEGCEYASYTLNYVRMHQEKIHKVPSDAPNNVCCEICGFVTK